LDTLSYTVIEVISVPNLGDAIRNARQQCGMTQEELAAKLDTTKSAISKYELGKREPSLEQLRKIAIAIGVTISDLVDHEYWSRVPKAELQAAFSDNPRRDLLLAIFDQLNEEGQSKAVERVEELTEIPKYKK